MAITQISNNVILDGSILPAKLNVSANLRTFLGDATSANLAGAVSGTTGSGNLVFATNPTLTNPTIIGDISSNGAALAGAAMTIRSTTSQQYVARFIGQNASYAGFSVVSTNAASKPFIQFGIGAESAANFTILQDSSTALSIRGGNALGGALLTITSSANIGINNASPDTKAALDITSTTKGFLPPRMTLSNRTTLSSSGTVPEGLIVYTTDNALKSKTITLYNGSGWDSVLTTRADSFTTSDLAAALSDGETGSGQLVLATNPTLSGANVTGTLAVTDSITIGIGTTSPSAKLHAIATTEQLRVGYDASNYLSTTVNSTGVTTLSAVGSGAKFAFSNNVEVTAAGGVAGSTIKIGGSGMALGFAAGGSSYSGVWCNNATPDFSNYTFLGDGNDSFFNAKATGKNYFRTGNTNRMMVDQNGVFIPGVGTNANPTTQQLTVIPSAASKIGAVIKGFASQTANLIEWQDSAGVVLASVTASGNISTTGHFSAATKSFKIPHQSKCGHLQYGVVESDCHSVLVRGKISSDTITLPEHWSWLVDADSVTVQLTPVGCYQQLYVISSDNQTVKVGGVTGEYCYVVYGTRKDVAPLEVEIE